MRGAKNNQTRSGVTYPYFYHLGRQHGTKDCPQGYMPVGDIKDAIHAYWAHRRLPTTRIQA